MPSPDPTQPPAEPQEMVIDFPVLPTDVQIGRLSTQDGVYVLLNLSTALTRGTFSLDREQADQLASQLKSLVRKIPKPKKLAVPRPAGETERPSGLVVPS